MSIETDIMNAKGVKPTPNRLLVLRALTGGATPQSFTELEQSLPTMDKSSIFRVLQHFVEHDIVHLIEGGDGVARYEACRGEGLCTVSDMHIHFYCTHCHRTYCLEQTPVPLPAFPPGFEVRAVNYMAKGLCPRCSHT